MADATRPAIGLSIGATNLAAVTADRSVTRKPVITLYQQRAPEVGLPSENPNLDEPGLVITDFVNRVGSSARVVAADGSTHRSEVLVADALRALVHVATDGGAVPEAIVVTYPAHWQPAAVDALRSALGRGSGWLRDEDPALLDDAAAAANALQTNPGLPSSGVIAVCDFGGSGTSLTLIEAANGYQRLGTTLRYTDFSGDLIDQALLNHVVADLSAAGSFDTSTTSAIGSLTRLRADCRRAKEQLSTTTVATLTADLPGYHGDVHLTRVDLDEAIRQPLAAFISAARDALQRNGVQPPDVVAVAAVGGGANIPVITSTLSDQLRAPVITAPRPQFTAAIGAALRAVRGPADPGATAPAPAADTASPAADVTTVLDPAPLASGEPALAWSEAGDDTGISPLFTGEYPAASSRHPVNVGDDAGWSSDGPAKVPWYRRTVVLIIAAALVLLAIAGAIMLALRNTSSTAPVTPTPSTSSGPGTSAPQTTASPNSTETQPSDTNQPPSTTSESPSPSSSSAPPSTTTTTEPSTTEATTTPPAFPPNRPFGPDFPRRPGGPEPGGGPGAQEPGLGGR